MFPPSLSLSLFFPFSFPPFLVFFSSLPLSRSLSLSLSLDDDSLFLPVLLVSVRLDAINKTFVTRRLWVMGTRAQGPTASPMNIFR